MATKYTVTEIGNGIKSKRWDTEAREIHWKSGRTEMKPASYEEHFVYEGRELANRSTSGGDCLYLNSDLIARGKKVGGATTYECALAGKYKDAYRCLFNILGITKDSKLSEFMNVYF